MLHVCLHILHYLCYLLNLAKNVLRKNVISMWPIFLFGLKTEMQS